MTKRFVGYIFFLWGWAAFILLFPDLLEKIGKWSPIIAHAGQLMTKTINWITFALPKAPNCGFCWHFIVFWPSIITMIILFIIYLVFFVIYLRLDPEVSRSKLAVLFLLVGGQLLVLYLSQAWLLYQFSGIPLEKSLSFILFESRVKAATDKSYFLNASNVYGVIIATSYLCLLLFLRFSWIYYNRHKSKG